MTSIQHGGKPTRQAIHLALLELWERTQQANMQASLSQSKSHLHRLPAAALVELLLKRPS